MLYNIQYMFGYIITRTINVTVTSILLLMSFIDKEYISIRQDPYGASVRVENYMKTIDNNKLTLAACEVLLYGKNIAIDNPGEFSDYEIWKISLYEISKLYFKLKLVAL